MDKRILAIIPARGGSKGLKKKNIKLLKDKPLIRWTIDEAKLCNNIDRIVVTSDCDEILNISNDRKVTLIKRPSYLATDESPTIDSIFHVLDFLKTQEYYPEYLVLLQCTTPFRKAIDIEKAIDDFINNEKFFDSLVSVTEEEYPPYWLKSMKNDCEIVDFLSYDKEQYKRRQDFSKLYKLNGCIYITSTKNLYKNKAFEGKKVKAYMMDVISSIDIDTEDDFKYAEYIAMSRGELE